MRQLVSMLQTARGSRVFLVGVMAAAMASPALATTFTVNTTADGVDANPGDGVCATVAGKCSLRACVNEHNALGGTNTCTLKAKVYNLTVGFRSAEVLGEQGDLDVGPGTLRVLGKKKNKTRINAGTLPSPGDRVFHVHEFAKLVLRDLTVEGGRVPDETTLPTGELSEGGGIACDGDTTAELVLNRVRVRNNQARDVSSGEGGGVYVEYCQTLIKNSKIVNNIAEEDGGGLYVDDYSEVNIHNTNIDRNDAGGYGGGMYHYGYVPLKMYYSTVSKNDSYDDGGGIYTDTGELEMFDSEIVGNNSTYGDGGGVYSEDDVLLERVRVARNDAYCYGGGIYHYDYRMTIVDSQISGNDAGDDCDGGGIYHEGEQMTIDGSLIKNNYAEADGGGIYHHSGDLGINNSHVIGNTGEDGGGLYSDGYPLSCFDTVFDDNFTNDAFIGDFEYVTGNCSF